jgi:hypothetical protein
MSSSTITHVETATASGQGSKHGCCRGEGEPKPRTGDSGLAEQCGGHSERLHHAHEMPPASAGSCCCGDDANDNPAPDPKGASVK